METYRLDLGKGVLYGTDYPGLQKLVDRVLVADIAEGDPHTSGRIIVGEKLIGFLLRNNPPTLFGVRFKEDSQGEHVIAGERYRKLNYSPEDLVLNEEGFDSRNVKFIQDRDLEHQTSYKLRGVIDGAS